MRILHFITSIDEHSGGIGAYLQLLARDLGKLCELHIVTHRTNNMRELENCTLHFVSDGLRNFRKVKSEFLEILNEVQPDVCHSNACWTPYNAFSLLWAKEAGYKTVLSPHGMLEPWIMKRNYWTKKLPAILLYQKKALVKADLIHSTADSEKINLEKLSWNKNIRVIGNCVQVDKIVIKKDWTRKKKILFLSRIHEKKGINFLLEAFAALKDRLSDYVVNIAGPGDEAYIDELKELAKRLDVVDRIKFLGPVFGDSKFNLYRESDVFILPTHSENFGIVVTEALASGTPVITTTGTPWKELNDCGCGWCIDVGTKPLEKALAMFLAKSDDELEKMGRKGRELVEIKYSSTVIAQQFYDMYNSLIKA